MDKQIQNLLVLLHRFLLGNLNEKKYEKKKGKLLQTEIALNEKIIIFRKVCNQLRKEGINNQ